MSAPRSKPEPIRLICGAVVLMSAAYFVIHAGLFYRDVDFRSFGLGDSDLSDFFAFYSAARLLWEGGPASLLYDSVALKAYQVTLGADEQHAHIFNYPPSYLFFIWPFGGLPYGVSLVLWQVSNLLIYAASLRLIGLRGFGFAAAVVAPATIVNFSAGQNGLLTTALLIGGLAFLSKRQGISGALFGLLTVKPHLGLLLPVACLATGRWVAIAVAILVALGLIGASALVFGPDSWSAYWAYLRHLPSVVQAQSSSTFATYSATVMMAGQIAGLPEGLALAIQVVVSLATIGAVFLAYRRPVDPSLRLCLLLVGVTLVTPYGFLYDLPLVAVAVVLLVGHGLRRGFLPGEVLCLGATWLVPFAGGPLNDLGLPLVPLVHLILFGFILARLRASPVAPTQDSTPA